MMLYNPYEILGISEDATYEQARAAYDAKAADLRNKRFEVGREGERAAENLQKIETAFREIERAHVAERAKAESGLGGKDGQKTDIYEYIQQLIKDGDIARAQQLLDEQQTRTAEWHYLQATVFFKNSWFLESKKQLELAVGMEPENTKYRDSLDALTRHISSSTISPDQLRQTTRPDSNGFTGGANNGTCTGNCCTDMCLANLCCNCLSCGCR